MERRTVSWNSFTQKKMTQNTLKSSMFWSLFDIFKKDVRLPRLYKIRKLLSHLLVVYLVYILHFNVTQLSYPELKKNGPSTPEMYPG